MAPHKRMNFSDRTKGERWKIAAGQCEGLLASGERCPAPLRKGKCECDHVIPSALGGKATIDNARWLCVQCHSAKTPKDVAIIAKAKRVEARDTFGKKESAAPMPAGRKSDTKIKITGEKVERTKPNNTPYANIGPTNLARRFQTVGE